MDNNMVTGLTFVHFKKAFDVTNHELLLTKLSIYGANDFTVKWFRSYLTGRNQYVCVNGCYFSRCISKINFRTYSIPCVYI